MLLKRVTAHKDLAVSGLAYLEELPGPVEQERTIHVHPRQAGTHGISQHHMLPGLAATEKMVALVQVEVLLGEEVQAAAITLKAIFMAVSYMYGV